MKAPKKRRQSTRARWDPPDRAWLEHHYHVLGKSACQIAREVGAGESGQIVAEWLGQLGIPVRRYHHQVPSGEILRRLYVTEGLSANELARRAGVDVNTVLGWLDVLGIPRRTKAEAFELTRGEKHYRWIGGGRRYARKVKHESGLPEICEICGSSRFIVVHHQDGDKNNNEPDNLRYLCKSCHKYAHS